MFFLQSYDFSLEFSNLLIFYYLCPVQSADGGAIQAEIIPFEPDSDNTDVGKK